MKPDNVEFNGWRKSRFCDTVCVEVAESGDFIGVRDSKHPGGPILTFTRGEWKAFIRGVTEGDFNIA